MHSQTTWGYSVESVEHSYPSHLQVNNLISCLFFLESKDLNHSSKELKGIAVVF